VTAQTVTVRQSYAGLVSRVVGLLIDVLLLTLGGLAVAALPAAAWRQIIGTPPGWLGEVTGTVAGLLPWAYFTLCWWLTGRTGGAFTVGLVVRRPNGARLGLIRAALRAAIGLALWPIWLLGLLGTLRDARRRAWHDRLFGTVVRYG
jgi:uncharacterized RDD family membrane protein YckC